MACLFQLPLVKRDRLAFAIIFILLAILIIAVNSIVIHVMVSRKLHKKFAYRILFILSILQLSYGFISCSLWVVLILLSENMDCFQARLMHLVADLFSYSTHATLLFLALDRFLRVRFMKAFNIKITERKYHTLYTTYLFLAVWQSSVANFGFEIFKPVTSYLLAAIDALVLVSSLTFYILSIIHLRRHQENSRKLTKTDNDITRLAKIYLLIILICYLPFVLNYLNIVFVGGFQGRTRGVAYQACLSIASTSGIANGVVFIRFATKERGIRDMLSSSG